MPQNDALLAAEGVVVTILAVSYGLAVLVGTLRRKRPDLRIGFPIAVGVLLRTAAVVGISATADAREFRGTDETVFLGRAQELVSRPSDAQSWFDTFTSALHEGIIAAQLQLFAAPDLALRITQIGIATAGVVLLAVAVYDLADARAATVAAWVLALEPTSIFFSGLLHEESNMLLAVGLIAFGGVKLWTGRRMRSLLPMALGSMIALATRPYAGWFLVLAGVAIAVASSFKHARKRPAGATLVLLVVGAGILLAVPTILGATSDESLRTNLQPSQDALTREGGGNLRFEPVDFSSRGAVIRNLPRRIRDVLLRPYPWQLSNNSQRLGALGTVVFLTLLALLAGALVRAGPRTLARAAPLVLPAAMLLIAYALSSGNAGQAFRHRTVLAALSVCVLLVVTEWRRKSQSSEAALSTRAPARPGLGRPAGALTGQS